MLRSISDKDPSSKYGSTEMTHYHSEISHPACMPEWSMSTYRKEVAIQELKFLFMDEDFTLNVYHDPFLAVLRYPGKPNTLNCFVYECEDETCLVETEGGHYE